MKANNVIIIFIHHLFRVVLIEEDPLNFGFYMITYHQYFLTQAYDLGLYFFQGNLLVDVFEVFLCCYEYLWCL